MSRKDFEIDFRHMTAENVPDGYGGVKTTFSSGAPFRAGIYTNRTQEADIAHKTGLHTTYTIVADIGITLKQHDVVQRVADGKLFRITSDDTDGMIPACAADQYFCVTAEVFEV